jgi:hypothetical protein
MKKRWIFALVMGAAAVTAGIMLSKHKNGKDKNEGDCFPEFCGFCGDSEMMQKECGYDMDNPSILHRRTRV